MKNTRIVFDDSYYVLHGILRSLKFQNKLTSYKADMKKAGYPIPENGFLTVANYHEWVGSISEANIYQYSFIDEIIEDFKVVDNIDAVRLGLVWNIFLGNSTPPLKPTVGYSSKVNKEENYIDLNIRFYTWSTKKEIDEVWGYINNLRQQLPAYTGSTKNKIWETFDRDFAIYELYLKVKSDIKNGIYLDKSDHSKSALMQINYYPEFDALKKEYGEKIEDQISPIVSRCKRIFKNLQVL